MPSIARIRVPDDGLDPGPAGTVATCVLAAAAFDAGAMLVTWCHRFIASGDIPLATEPSR